MALFLAFWKCRRIFSHINIQLQIWMLPVLFSEDLLATVQNYTHTHIHRSWAYKDLPLLWHKYLGLPENYCNNISLNTVYVFGMIITLINFNTCHYTQIAPTIFEDLPENRVYGVLKERRKTVNHINVSMCLISC